MFSAPNDKCSLVTEAGGSRDLNASEQGSAPRPLMLEPNVNTGKPKIKKPPRKSKLLEEKSVKNLTESDSGENWQQKNNEGESPAVSSGTSTAGRE